MNYCPNSQVRQNSITRISCWSLTYNISNWCTSSLPITRDWRHSRLNHIWHELLKACQNDLHACVLQVILEWITSSFEAGFDLFIGNVWAWYCLLSWWLQMVAAASRRRWKAAYAELPPGSNLPRKVAWGGNCWVVFAWSVRRGFM
jgi:hypothetical protein